MQDGGHRGRGLPPGRRRGLPARCPSTRQGAKDQDGGTGAKRRKEGQEGDDGQQWARGQRAEFDARPQPPTAHVERPGHHKEGLGGVHGGPGPTSATGSMAAETSRREPAEGAAKKAGRVLGRVKSYWETQYEFLGLKQGKGESVEDFANRVRKAARLLVHRTERECQKIVAEVFLNGLADRELASHMAFLFVPNAEEALRTIEVLQSTGWSSKEDPLWKNITLEREKEGLKQEANESPGDFATKVERFGRLSCPSREEDALQKHMIVVFLKGLRNRTLGKQLYLKLKIRGIPNLDEAVRLVYRAMVVDEYISKGKGHYLF